MKRRIISMLLIVVMLALSLASCGYSYAKDDMTQYTVFDKEKFEAGLASIIIKDGDFTTDGDVNTGTRAIKVLDSIYEALAKAVDADDKSTEGKISGYDVLYYTYFCTVTVGDGDDAKEYTVLADAMAADKAKNVQLGLSDNSGVAKLIADAVALLDVDVKDYIYKTKTSGKTAAGDKIYVTYTRTYDKPGEGDQPDVPVSETVRYGVLTVGEANGQSFADKLVDKTIGEKFGLEAVFENIDGVGDNIEVTYKDITIHWVVEDEGAPIVAVKDTTYTASNKVYPTEHYTGSTDNKIDLNGKELTYYVYPVYYKDVSELNATAVLEEIFNSNLTATSLPMFETDTYKTEIEKLATLFDELVDLEKKLETAKKKVDSTKTAAEKNGATQAQKDAYNNAVVDHGKVQDDVDDKNKEIGDQIKKILDIDKTSNGDDDLSTEEQIVKEYKDSVYKNLENSYNNEITYAVAEKIYNLIEETVTFKDGKFPEKALNEAYDVLYDSYKATFYTEKNSSTNKTYYSEHNGDFMKFLISQKKSEGATDEKSAKEAVRKEAKEAITPIIKIYAVAQAYGETLLYTDKDYNEENKNTNLGTYEDYYGAVNIKAAEQIDKILDYYLKLKDDKVTKDDNGSITKIEYVEVDGVLVLPYERISYKATEDGSVTE